MIFPKVQLQDVGRTDEVEAGVVSKQTDPNLHVTYNVSEMHSVPQSFNLGFQREAEMAGSLSPFCFAHLLPFFPLPRSSTGTSLQELLLTPALRLYRQAPTLTDWHS